MSNSRLDTLPPSDLQRLLNAVPVPLFIKNASGEVLYLNAEWKQALGLGHGPLAAADKPRFFSPEQMAAFAAQDQVAFALRHTVTNEDEVWREDLQHCRRLLTTLAPVFDDAGQPQFLVGTTLDVSEQRLLQQQAHSERQLLEMLASNAKLVDIMTTFILDFEGIFPGVTCSVLLLDDDGVHLRHGAAPNLPEAYCQAINGAAIGPHTGSCGTAAYTGQDTLVTDITADPRWDDYRELALAHGYHACWSIPIRSTKGVVLGSFGNYYRHVRAPSEAELQAITRSAYLLGLAIERDRNERQMLADRHALEEAGRYRQAILDSMVDGLLTMDRRGAIHSYNNAACHMLGYGNDMAFHRTLNDLLAVPLDAEADGTLHLLADANALAGAGKTVEVQGRHHSGATFPISLSVSRIPQYAQETYVAVLRDVTQQRQDEEEIRRLAFYDPLTGLPNRRLLMDRVRQAMANSSRLGQHGALMFLDLDHFKLLNDTLGHDVGDELLQQVAERLRLCVREGDSVARLGGDEFVVLLEALSPNMHEAATQAEVVAHKVLEALAVPYNLRQHTYSSTPSIGIVMFMQDHQSMDDLLKKADVAMYQAKAAGRNTVRFFDPVMQAAVATHAELAKEIRQGLQRHEFVLHYQVQMDTQGQCIGAEALVRWNHSVRGLVTPAHFIPLAEETGMILPLGQWVLEAACRQLLEWGRHRATAQWTLAVNVSASQLAQPNFVDSVATALRTTGAPPHLLKMELTESMLVNDVEDLIVKMGAVQAMGVKFSLDDFGTGYSSLSYLKRLPLSQLKIDQSFVRDVLTDPSDAVIARTIVALGHSLGLAVLAEGVETAEQRDFLAEIGCDAFQGYFFGRPIPALTLAATLALAPH
ncbi:EAL domain-containing protein [Rhodoferax saidenbachensis]|uniref:Diguanylate cyclase (GGDEF)-like protein/PAS domain S-box-containing protein n=1 Tax=Rhodoferax saidenbachensis TaxID=1484693 RepID=A0ABU1ZTC8_9BURK|nr:EAL domain-containing protein [Rhodoferax saidenbachensis]MDR7308807.1 diguanylate cyclase (GGDEF)-like protein/PAS domain S-box-containing protein [Rhodoferax saidenbachensis]